METEASQFMIYLAGPVDGISNEDALGWRVGVAREFPTVAFFVPPTAYLNISPSNAGRMDHMNRHAIRCSSAVLANLCGPGRGFGTIREIEFARANSKRVTVCCDDEGINDSLLTYDLDVASDPITGMQQLLVWLTDAVNTPQMPSFLGIPFQMPPQDEDD